MQRRKNAIPFEFVVAIQKSSATGVFPFHKHGNFDPRSAKMVLRCIVTFSRKSRLTFSFPFRKKKKAITTGNIDCLCMGLVNF